VLQDLRERKQHFVFRQKEKSVDQMAKMANILTGTKARKTLLQPKFCVRIPPKKGPRDKPV
jgi:hypothetical protein